MARHVHEHTHVVHNPNSKAVHPDIEHSHDHDDWMNEHHHYSEEPAEPVLGPITPGLWQCALDAASMTPRVYVERGDQTEEVIAQVVRLSDSDGQDRSVANAKLMTFSPALLRFVQHLAVQEGGGVIPHRDAALALIEQLDQMEVRSDADRW